MGMRPNSTTTPSGARNKNGKQHPPAQHCFKQDTKTLGVPLGEDLVGPDRASPNLLILIVRRLRCCCCFVFGRGKV